VTPTGPTILALDFDGVLAEGRAEMFETSCRTYCHFWSPSTLATRHLKDGFRRLRPVITSGWEMPLLVQALVRGVTPTRILRAWPAVREEIVGGLGVPRAELVRRIGAAFDGIRRDWIWAGRASWLELHRPYVALDVLRRVVAAPERTAVVTTKEGEFVRLILEHWNVRVDAIEGKEAGEHKCETLLRLMTAYAPGAAAHRPGAAAHRSGAGPTLWFVEDRIETLECVKACSRTDPRLAAVRLFLASWGYTTRASRAAARRDDRIRLLTLSAFAKGFAAWPSS
jgi:hypothetical protein